MRRFGVISFTAGWMLALPLLIVQPVHGQDWAKAALAKSSRHGEFVTIPEPGGRMLQAWVVYPEVKEKAPVVVMIHEIFGQSDWAREMADEVAGAGYIVVAPDLLSGLGPAQAAAVHPAIPSNTKVTLSPCPAALGRGDGASCTVTSAELQAVMAGPMIGMRCDPMDCSGGSREHATNAEECFLDDGAAGGADGPRSYADGTEPCGCGVCAGVRPGGTSAFPDQGQVTRAVMSLPDAQVIADLDAAADYGKKLPAANGKVFVAGFCWGGGKSFLFATHRKDLSAAFVFYGTPPPAAAMANINAPVYGFYAEKDARVSATIPQTTTDMKAAGKVYEPVVYDGAGHGFMRAGEAPDANAANTAARQEGFRRLVKLLGGVR